MDLHKGIGTLKEKSLHAGLKVWYSQPGDHLETRVDGYVIDIRRDDLLIEIQTANFSSIKKKLNRLLKNRKVHLVYPLTCLKWIVRLEEDGGLPLGRRKSPKKGRLETLFTELVRIPHLVAHPNFSLEVLMITEEEIRCPGKVFTRSVRRRHGWALLDRKLLEVIDRVVLKAPGDFLEMLPAGLPELFTTAHIAEKGSMPVWLARKMAYCLREMGVIQVCGKSGNAILYRAPNPMDREESHE